MKWIILLIISFLVLLNIIGVESAHSDTEIIKFDTDSSYTNYLIDNTAFLPNAPLTSILTKEMHTYSIIRTEVKKYDWNADIIFKILNCESEYDVRAFNPELAAKKRGITKFSSCGLLQINSSECDEKESKLYDFKYNISQGYSRWKNQGYDAWRGCYAK